jgi:Trichohyalin-plectin-homology domain
LEEQKRLDEMMEVDRVNAVRIEENIEKKRKEERLIGALKIMEQIEENEQVCSLYKILSANHIIFKKLTTSSLLELNS